MYTVLYSVLRADYTPNDFMEVTKNQRVKEADGKRGEKRNYGTTGLSRIVLSY